MRYLEQSRQSRLSIALLLSFDPRRLRAQSGGSPQGEDRPFAMNIRFSPAGFDIAQ
jgi:hypothetical protein